MIRFLLIILATFSFFGLAYVLSVWLVSKKGWDRLAKRFSYDGRSTGKNMGFPDLYISGLNYKNGVRLRVTKAGLYLKVRFYYGFNHPPLLIPWSEISEAREKPEGRHHFTRLVISDQKPLTIDVPNRVFEAMKPFWDEQGGIPGILG